jgi:hypothetical protein
MSDGPWMRESGMKPRRVFILVGKKELESQKGYRRYGSRRISPNLAKNFES